MNIELMRQLGNMDQIAGIRRYRTESGARMAEVYNAAGLRFTVAGERCLDLYDLSYKGVNFAFHSKNGMESGKKFTPLGAEFFHYWPAGMLVTCGLASSGAGCQDETGVHPIHGRIGYASAEDFNTSAGWTKEDFSLKVSGNMAETRLYGRNLQLAREISTTLYSREITVRDRITNCGDQDEGYMLLYHFNFGYPLLDAEARFACTQSKVNQIAGPSEDYRPMGTPVDGAGEKLYVHQLQTDICHAGILNYNLGLGACLTFDGRMQPVMLEWKNLKSHDYVLGIEPCNCFSKGRVDEKENGTLPMIPAYESREYTVTLRILDGEDELNSFARECGENE